MRQKILIWMKDSNRYELQCMMEINATYVQVCEQGYSCQPSLKIQICSVFERKMTCSVLNLQYTVCLRIRQTITNKTMKIRRRDFV